MVFSATKDMNFEAPDKIVKDVTSRKLFIPVMNNTDDDLQLKRGTYLGDMTEAAEEKIDTNYVASVGVNDTCGKIGDVNTEDMDKINEIFSAYESKVELKLKSTSVPHDIDLVDNVPIS